MAKRMYQFMVANTSGRETAPAREYGSRRSAERYAKTHNFVIIGSYPTSDPPPANSDARAWDAWRARQNDSGCHH